MSCWEVESMNNETRPMIAGSNCDNAASCGFTAASASHPPGSTEIGTLAEASLPCALLRRSRWFWRRLSRWQAGCKQNRWRLS